jgi:hypothetical protein
VLLATPLVWADVVVVPPTLTMNPNGNTPLAGIVELTTRNPAQVTLEISDGFDLWRVKFPEVAELHSHPLLGLKPNRVYTVEVILNPGGSAGTLLAVIDSLPEHFPAVTTLVSDPQKMEPGYTLLDCVRHGRGDPRPTYSIIVDDRGDVVWYSTRCASSYVRLPTGNLLFRCGGTAVCESDLLGNEIVLTDLADPGDGLHHDLVPTALGTYLSLSRKTIEIPDYPSSETDPNAPTQTAEVRDEPIVEFMSDGTLLNEWSLTDIIDPTRIGYDSLNLTSVGLDWVHNNAVILDPSDDSVIVSVRHQDAVVKFSRATGELLWILGPHANWTTEFQPFLLQPVGLPFEWQYHPHAPEITSDGTLLLFDNGNHRASPFDGTIPLENTENYSRAVEYLIDEENMEVRQVWEWGSNATEPLYAGFVGDADRLETTGNVLMTFGGTTVVNGETTEDLGLGSAIARIVEVEHVEQAEPVFDLQIHDPGLVQGTVYRSDRIPALHVPGVSVVELGPIAVGGIPNGADVAGTPLLLGKAGGDDVTLSWSASCVSSDIDYEIYEGTLGDFTSHVPAFCSTDEATSKTFTPLAGDSYYLVVPTNGLDEGSYGSGTFGPRPQSASACLAQAAAACP